MSYFFIMRILQITEDVKTGITQDILEQFPFLAQDANGAGYLYKERPVMDHKGYWTGVKYSDSPILSKPYCHDWEQSMLHFDSGKKLKSIGGGAFFVPITEQKSEKFKKEYIKSQVELNGVFTQVCT